MTLRDRLAEALRALGCGREYVQANDIADALLAGPVGELVAENEQAFVNGYNKALEDRGFPT